jgi:hypothetical protein
MRPPSLLLLLPRVAQLALCPHMHNDVVHVLTPLYKGAQNSSNAKITLTLPEGGYVPIQDLI